MFNRNKKLGGGGQLANSNKKILTADIKFNRIVLFIVLCLALCMTFFVAHFMLKQSELKEAVAVPDLPGYSYGVFIDLNLPSLSSSQYVSSLGDFSLYRDISNGYDYEDGLTGDSLERIMNSYYRNVASGIILDGESVPDFSRTVVLPITQIRNQYETNTYKFKGLACNTISSLSYVSSFTATKSLYTTNGVTTIWFEAEWEEVINYDITLNDNGGANGSGTLSVVDATAQASSVNVPTRAGYTFNGYFTQTTGGTQYINSSGAVVSGANFNTPFTTLYAQWTPKNYSITYFDGLGSAIGATGPTTYNIETESFALSAPPAKNGYEFIGYTYTITGSETNSPSLTTPTTSITISTGTTGNINVVANYQVVYLNIAFAVDTNTPIIAQVFANSDVDRQFVLTSGQLTLKLQKFSFTDGQAISYTIKFYRGYLSGFTVSPDSNSTFINNELVLSQNDSAVKIIHKSSAVNNSIVI